jgi:hypothetical protein
MITDEMVGAAIRAYYGDVDGDPRLNMRAAIAAALAVRQGEPVAWYDSLSGVVDFHSFKPARKPSSPSAEWLPLYAHPSPPPETASGSV